jgi:hypothetical protein
MQEPGGAAVKEALLDNVGPPKGTAVVTEFHDDLRFENAVEPPAGRRRS